MADAPKHSVSVAGIVVDDDDRVLIIQRRDNAHWEPPGGVLELDESPQEGVVREVFEETGLKVEPCRLSGVYKNAIRGVVSLVFQCRPIAGAITVTDESSRVEWVSLALASERMDPAYFVRVSDALLDEVPVRLHDGSQLI